jgi:Ca2+-binding EF-hand superfamily protein
LDNKFINLAAFDLLFVATNVSANKFILSAERDLNRYEFIELIVRTAIFRFKDTKLTDNVPAAIDMLLTQLIYPTAKSMHGEHFRKYYCYNIKTNEILKNNEANLYKIYSSFMHSTKKYIRIEEAQAYIRALGLNISEMMVGAIYAESLMTIEDTISERERNNKMRFVEFLVFLCRISHEHYQGTPYEKEVNYLKIDHLMPTFMNHYNMTPVFRFGEKFEVEAEIEMEKLMKRRRKLENRKQAAIKHGVPVDKHLQSEIEKLDEELKIAGLDPFENADDGKDDEVSSESLSGDTGEENSVKVVKTEIKHPAGPTVSGVTVYDGASVVYEKPKDYQENML